MKKLAFIFMLYDRINHEKLWFNFFKNISPELYTIIIYSKEKVSLKHLSNYYLAPPFLTKYKSYSIVFNQNHLLKYALQDKNVSHCIFLSAACIPLKSFSKIYEKIHMDFSYFNIAPDFQIPKNILEKINKNIIVKKSSQWSIINRKHSKILTEKLDYYSWFLDYDISPDEYCYISKLYTLKLEDEIVATKNLSVWATTFCNWSDIYYIYYTWHSWLKNYSYISKPELDYLLDSNSFFARKFLSWAVTDMNQSIDEYISIKLNI